MGVIHSSYTTYPTQIYTFQLNSFQAMLPYMGAKKGSFFTGVFLPQKLVLLSPIKTQCKPFQKHVSSY
jgi:hypothetical protein